MKSKIFGLLAVALLAGPSAHALTVSAGESVAWSFNVTGQPQPWLGVTLYTGLDTGTYDFDAGYWTIFDSSDATGSNDVFNGANIISLAANSSYPPMYDGIFSVRLTMTSGSISVAPCATARYATYESGCSAGARIGAAVPEPGTLALLGLGLAGLGLSRRRKAA